MSKIKTEKNRDNRRDIELPPNAQTDAPLEVQEQTGAEKILMASQPYWTLIALGLLVFILAWVIVSYLMQSNRESAAEPSRQLADAMQQFNVTTNVDSLKQMKEDFPNEVATNWAMLVAGDYELNRGLSQYASDREGGMKLVKRAKESFQSVVDSPSSAKTTMQQRRSLFSLAYAHEALGEFSEAQALYQQVLDESPDSIFADSAKNGLERSGNPDFEKLYREFASFKPAMEEAPGVAVPEAPVIDFPEIDLPKEEPATDTSSAETSGDEKMTVEVAKPATEVAAPLTAEPVVTKKEVVPADPVVDEKMEAAVDTIEETTGTAVEEATEKVETVGDAVDAATEKVESGVEVVADAVEGAVEGVVDGVKEAVGK
jgi:tetratricopeptide (TPR) repeat protein